MARNDGKDRTVVRNTPRTAMTIPDAEKHNERKKESYRNEDIVPERSSLNVHYKSPTGSYSEMFSRMEQEGIISTRGLKQGANLYGELVFDVNSAYFHNHGGYEFAKEYYRKAYEAAVEIVGGEQYILSAVMHADERNRGMSQALGYDVWHYHLHVVYVPVVEKQILWSKRCKDPALVGTVRETITQVSHSKKWASSPVLDEDGQPMYSKSGKIILRKSYSILQDKYHDHMVAAGYTDLERGERGSTEEHLTTVQFKVMKEEAHLERLLQQQQTAKQAVSDVQKEREEKEKAAKEAEMKLRITEKEREEKEQAAKEAEMKLRITEKEAQKTLDFVQKLGPTETILEKPGRLESARSVYTRSVTVIGKLIGKLKNLLVLYHGERAKNETLTRENRIWQERAVLAKETTEKAGKFDQLAKILGLEEIERILKEHTQHTKERIKNTPEI